MTDTETATDIDAGTFRQIMGSLPTGVSVVTTVDGEGAPRGLTCNALCSVSLDPPLVLVCVTEHSSTLDAMRSSGGFVVNLLRSERDHVSQLFASPEPDKFEQVSWCRSTVGGLPHLLDDTIAHADCRIEEDLQLGDHAAVVGRVVGGGRADEDPVPLLYWQRQYCGWPLPVGP